MDNLSHDNLGVEDVEKVVKGISDIAKNVRNNKIKKEAQKISDAGNYWFLTSTAKKLIPIPNYVIQQITGKGITQEAVLNYPKQPKDTPIDTIISALQIASGLQPSSTGVTAQAVKEASQTVTNAETASKIKKFLPYVLGALAIGLVVWMLSKK